MKRSGFLVITGLGAATLYALSAAWTRHVIRDHRAGERAASWNDLDRSSGRCIAARRPSRWFGYTSDDVVS